MIVRITTGSNHDALTTITGYKLHVGRVLLFRGKSLLRKLRRVPGLTAAAVFRSYDRRSLIVYMQWKDRVSAEISADSVEYRRCFASIGKNTFPQVLCNVTFVDDARPVRDDLNALILHPKKDDYVTLVSTFDVPSDRREELLSLLQRDHDFLREFDGFVAIAFHKAVDRENVVVELLQFQSALKLLAVSKAPRGAAHLAAVDAVAKVSANSYRLTCGFERAV